MWLTISVLMIGVGVCLHAQHLLGDHVCPQEEKYTVTVEKVYKKNVTIREFVWCLNVPPRCSKYRIEEKTINKIEEETHVKKIDKCCEGYREDENKYCVPACKKCVHGICNKPDKCECSSGFTGPDCNQTCPVGYWGFGCIEKCNCINALSCDSKTGFCQCISTWTGPRCDISTINLPPVANCTPDECNITTTNTPETVANTEGVSDAIDPDNLQDTPAPVQELTSPEVNDQSFVQETTISTTDLTRPHMENYNKNKGDYKLTDTTETNVNTFERSQVTTSPIVHDVTVDSKKNFNTTGKIHLSSDNNYEKLHMDDIQIENTNTNFYINKYGLLLFSISTTIVFILILISIAVVSILIVRYKKKRIFVNERNEVKSSTDDNENRLSTQPIIRHSIFHTPLPDPPPFENPVFSLTTNDNTLRKEFDNKVYCNKSDVISENNDLQYDFPPSTGSYRAVSIPEPEPEPIYDEIPMCRRPTPVILSSTTGICIVQCGYNNCVNDKYCQWHKTTC